jgi:hypothetical protein
MSYIIPNVDLDLYPQKQTQNQDGTYVIPDFDIDVPVSTVKPNSSKGTAKVVKGAETFQPSVNFDINAVLPSIKELFKNQFGRELPYKLGETPLHKKLGLDHRNSADIALDPDSKEGQFLLNYFRENNIPFRASRGREYNSKGKLISTNKHIHTGLLSHSFAYEKANQDNQSLDLSSYDIPDVDLDIPNIDKYKVPEDVELDTSTLDNTDEIKTNSNSSLEYLDNLGKPLESNVPQIPLDYDEKPKLVSEDFKKIGLSDITTDVVGNPVFNPIKLYKALGQANPEKAAYYLQLLKQGKAAVIKNKNPDRLLKPIEVNVVSRNKEVPTNNEIIETYLFQYDPELIEINRKFKNETGKDLIGVQLGQHPYVYKDGMYSYLFQTEGSIIRQLNAYAKGGMDAYKKETENISKEREAYINEKTAIENFFVNGGKDRAYLKGFEVTAGSVASTILENITTPEEREQLTTGLVDDFNLGNLQLAHNVEMLGRAINVSVTKGMESKEYLDLMNEDVKREYNIEQAKALLPNARFDAKSGKYLYTDSAGTREITKFEYGKLVTSRGVGSTISSIPKMIAVGRSLPFLVFLENAHLGVPEATKQAFAMIPMLAAGELVGGLTAENVANANYSLGSRILRNLEVRGVQGGSMALTDLVLNGDEYLKGRRSLFDLAPSFSIGAAFPVGKVKRLSLGKAKSLDLKLGTNLTYESEIGPNPYGVSEPLRVSNVLGKGVGAVNVEGNASELSVRHDIPVDRVRTLLGYDLDQLNALKQVLNTKITKFNTKETFVYESDLTNVNTSKDLNNLVKNIYQKTPDLSEAVIQKHELQNANISQSQKELNVINDILHQKNLSDTQGIARLPIYDLALNLLDQKRALKNKTYLEKGMKLTEQNIREKNLKDNIAFLETALPKTVIDLVSANEKKIRLAISGKDLNAQLRIEHRAKLEQDKLLVTQDVKPQDKFTKKDVIKQASEPTTKGFSAIDNLAAGIAHYKDEGVNNKFTTQEHANLVRQSFSNNVQELVERLSQEHGAIDISGGNLPHYEKRFGKLLQDTATDLTYLAAFHIEDFYRRKIEPTISNFRERLIKDLGQEFGNLIKPEQVDSIFNKGMTYYESNNADPFFSSLKQNILENFPTSLKAESVKGLLEKYGTKNELDWTSGLWDFVNNKVSKKEKISKDELLNVIQNGQIKVDEVVLGKQTPRDKNRVRVDEVPNNGYSPRYTVSAYSPNGEFSGYLDNNSYSTKEAAEEAADRAWNIHHTNNEPTRYDLKTYKYEKLELEGGKNPKEVLLQVPENLVDNELYSTSHWKDSNVVAHFRANERETIDGLKVFHGEEFQSDWNQQGREEGYKLTKKELENDYIVTKTEDGNFLFTNKTKPDDSYETLNSPKTKNEAIDVILNAYAKDVVPKNPFMENHWKELSFKRFLRMGIEMGKDGITWTTSRQQQERYKKVAEGKAIGWAKNTDGTYSINLETGDERGLHQTNDMRNISLKEVERLTNSQITENIKKLESNGRTHGIIDLESTIQIGKGYSDYDTYFVNLAKKIGKRFGAEYKIKEIETSKTEEYSFNDRQKAINEFKSGKEIHGITTFGGSKKLNSIEEISNYNNFLIKGDKKIEQVHYLEITPQMRDSLLKEGQPLYGINLNEPLKPSAEIGIRNRIVTKDVWDSARTNIIDNLNQTLVTDEGLAGGTILNTGLNPEAFIDQFKLLYKGYKDFKDFSLTIIKQFGDKIIPHLNDLWNYVQDKAIKFNEDESGKLLFWNGKNSPSTDAFFKKNFIKRFTKNPIEATLNSHIIRRTLNTVALAEMNPNTFGLVFDKIRDAEGVANSQVNNIVSNLIEASKLDPKLRDKVGEVWYTGIEEGKTYNLQELLTGDPNTNRPALNSEQADAYFKARKAQDTTLNIQLNQELYYAHKVLDTLVPNTPEYIKQLGNIQKIIDHYKNDLMQGGYGSLKRLGSLVIEGENPAFPIGDFKRRVYSHARNKKEMQNLEDSWRGRGYTNITVTDLASLGKDKIVNMGRKLTPAEFEDLVIRSGANTNDPEVQQVRELVYSRYGSHSYKLRRDFTQGYERTWDNMIESIHAQMSVYENSFRNNIGREEAVKTLNSTNLLKSDKDLYDLALSYIEDSTQPIPPTRIGQIFSTGRQAVSVMQLAGDVSQFYMNAYLQPITQTYSYFARIPEVKGLDTDAYFAKGQVLAHKVIGNKYLGTKAIIDPVFSGLVDRGFNENVLNARMTEMIAGDPAGKMKNRFMNTAFIFNRAGEVVTRLHAFSEAYLIGTEKLKLSGEDLYKFMRRAVDVTQGVGGNAENPYWVRRTGEVGKAFYQFGKFNQMWLENLGLTMKADFEALKSGGFKFSTGRHLGALGIVGGIASLPLTAFGATLYTLVTGDDPKKKFKEYMKDHELLYNLANYGTPALPAYILNTSAEGLSRKVAIPAPILDSIDQYVLGAEGILQGKGLNDISVEQLKNFPIYTTLNQLFKAPDAIRDKRYTDAIPIKSIRNVAKSGENFYDKYNNQRGNIKTPSGNRIISADKLSYADILLQLIGISPAQIGDYYDKKRAKTLKNSTTGKKVRRFAKGISQ